MEQTGYLRKIHQRMENPQVGDTVVETTSRYMKSTAGDRVGNLLRVAEERAYPDEPEETATITVHYIETPDGREIRWTNCEFIAVLADYP